MILTIAFVATAVILCVAVVLAVFAITHVQMSGPQAIERDGLPRGARAPAWSLADSTGKIHTSPPLKPMQLVVFGSHSLKEFPSAVDGLRELAAEDEDVEIVLLLRGPNHVAEPVLRILGLPDIPVLTGTPSLYGRYNVRVAPFAIFVDSTGRVRGSSLVNHSWQIHTLRKIADLPPPAAPRAAARRSRGHAARVEA